MFLICGSIYSLLSAHWMFWNVNIQARASVLVSSRSAIIITTHNFDGAIFRWIVPFHSFDDDGWIHWRMCVTLGSCLWRMCVTCESSLYMVLKAHLKLGRNKEVLSTEWRTWGTRQVGWTRCLGHACHVAGDWKPTETIWEIQVTCLADTKLLCRTLKGARYLMVT